MDKHLPDYVTGSLSQDQIVNRLEEYETEEILEVYLIKENNQGKAVLQRVVCQGYNGKMEILVTISISDNILTGIKILAHQETPDYGDYLTENWFLKRFIGKGSDQRLVVVKMFNHNPEEVVAITGATQTSKGVVAGVNKAFKNYNLISGGIR